MLLSFVLHLCLWHLIGVFGVESVSVMEGESVTLHTYNTEIHEDDDLIWKFGTETHPFARINKDAGIFNISDGPDGRFRDRLILNHKTGDLTITNTRITDTGLYKLEFNGAKMSLKTFSVTVNAHLPVPVITRDSSQCSSSCKCVFQCSVVNVTQATLSWYKGNSSLSSISVSDLNSLSLPLEVEYQENNTYSCVINNPIRNQTKHLNITEVCQTCSVPRHSDVIRSCDSTEAVIRLVVSALMGVAAVAAIVVLGYDIRSRRLEQKRSQTSHVLTSGH